MLLFRTVIVKLSKHEIYFAQNVLYNQRSRINRMLESDFRVQEWNTRWIYRKCVSDADFIWY